MPVLRLGTSWPSAATVIAYANRSTRMVIGCHFFIPGLKNSFLAETFVLSWLNEVLARLR